MTEHQPIMQRTSRRTRIWLYGATVLGGGMLPATCETRIHDAVVDGSRNFAYVVLDPSNISGFPFEALLDDLLPSDDSG